MNVLVLGLYAEGRTDERFLPVVIRRTTHLHALGVPEKAKLVESVTYPKETLYQVIQKVYPNQPHLRGQIKSELYEKLAPVTSLDRLNQVSSYKQFVTDLTATLKTL